METCSVRRAENGCEGLALGADATAVSHYAGYQKVRPKLLVAVVERV